jgi:cytoskeletal protein CcmA (bactofilin family)
MIMTTHPMHPVRSEKGIALIVVLLLLGVMAALTTGLTLNGQTEVAMSANEFYYAGARAAAEAGMNRAIDHIVKNNALNLLDTKEVPGIGNGPFDLDSQYSYSFSLLDDDDPALYATALTADQLAAMEGELGDADLDHNSRMILRATGFGPNGTSVTVARILETVAIPDLPSVTTINPAILVNGNLDMSGNIRVLGSEGNVHANGDITGGGSEDVSGDITATGAVDSDLDPDGMVAGGMPSIPIPEIKAADYLGLATHKLKSDGSIQVKDASGNWVACSGKAAGACPSGWTFSGGTWSASGSMPTSGVAKSTYYVEGSAEIHGTGKSAGFTQISVIAEGSLKITGNGKFKPGNDSKIQFVTNGDFELGGTVDADDSVDMDGQIMVREQMKIYGNSEFQGRVMVENRASDSNAYDAFSNPNGRKGASAVDANSLAGNMSVTYNGSLDPIESEIPGGPDTYINTISGWIEQ